MQKLTQDDAANIRPILQRLSRRTGKSITLDHLLQRWSELVRQLQRGDQFTGYDYTNDLAVRDFLEDVIRDAPVSTREKIAGQVDETDRLFRQATRASARPVFGAPAKESAWWWRRMPSRIDDDTRVELESE